MIEIGVQGSLLLSGPGMGRTSASFEVDPLHYQPYFGVALFTGRRGEHTAGLAPTQLADLQAPTEALAARPAHLEAFRQRVLVAAARQA